MTHSVPAMAAGSGASDAVFVRRTICTAGKASCTEVIAGPRSSPCAVLAKGCDLEFAFVGDDRSPDEPAASVRLPLDATIVSICRLKLPSDEGDALLALLQGGTWVVARLVQAATRRDARARGVAPPSRGDGGDWDAGEEGSRPVVELSGRVAELAHSAGRSAVRFVDDSMGVRRFTVLTPGAPGVAVVLHITATAADRGGGGGLWKWAGSASPVAWRLAPFPGWAPRSETAPMDGDAVAEAASLATYWAPFAGAYRQRASRRGERAAGGAGRAQAQSESVAPTSVADADHAETWGGIVRILDVCAMAGSEERESAGSRGSSLDVWGRQLFGVLYEAVTADDTAVPGRHFRVVSIRSEGDGGSDELCEGPWWVSNLHPTSGIACPVVVDGHPAVVFFSGEGVAVHAGDGSLGEAACTWSVPTAAAQCGSDGQRFVVFGSAGDVHVVTVRSAAGGVGAAVQCAAVDTGGGVVCATAASELPNSGLKIVVGGARAGIVQLSGGDEDGWSCLGVDGPPGWDTEGTGLRDFCLGAALPGGAREVVTCVGAGAAGGVRVGAVVRRLVVDAAVQELDSAPTLLPLQTETDSLLLLSSPRDGDTQVLRTGPARSEGKLGGDGEHGEAEIEMFDLPGLRCDAETIAVGVDGTGRVVQVTQQGVFVLATGSGDTIHSWSCQDTLGADSTDARVLCSVVQADTFGTASAVVVVGVATAVVTLAVARESGRVVVVATNRTFAQPSGVVCWRASRLPARVGAKSEPGWCVATGLWEGGTLFVHAMADSRLRTAVTAAENPAEPPDDIGTDEEEEFEKRPVVAYTRADVPLVPLTSAAFPVEAASGLSSHVSSLACGLLARVDAPAVRCVAAGLGDGRAALFTVDADQALHEVGVWRVGAVAVKVELSPGTAHRKGVAEHVFATDGFNHAILAPNGLQDKGGSVLSQECVACVAVAAPRTRSGPCSLHVPGWEGCRAWVDDNNRLCFGHVEADRALRWTEFPADGAPFAPCFHASSRSYLFTSRTESCDALVALRRTTPATADDDDDGGNDGDAAFPPLSLAWCMPLEPLHEVAAMKTVRLQARGAAGVAQPAEEFVAVASNMIVPDEARRRDDWIDEAFLQPDGGELPLAREWAVSQPPEMDGVVSLLRAATDTGEAGEQALRFRVAAADTSSGACLDVAPVPSHPHLLVVGRGTCVRLLSLVAHASEAGDKLADGGHRLRTEADKQVPVKLVACTTVPMPGDGIVAAVACIGERVLASSILKRAAFAVKGDAKADVSQMKLVEVEHEAKEGSVEGVGPQKTHRSVDAMWDATTSPAPAIVRFRRADGASDVARVHTGAGAIVVPGTVLPTASTCGGASFVVASHAGDIEQVEVASSVVVDTLRRVRAALPPAVADIARRGGSADANVIDAQPVTAWVRLGAAQRSRIASTAGVSVDALRRLIDTTL